jgi:hypothetical protein
MKKFIFPILLLGGIAILAKRLTKKEADEKNFTFFCGSRPVCKVKTSPDKPKKSLLKIPNFWAG